jgi:predicted branched-subunit amino acid permease
LEENKPEEISVIKDYLIVAYLTAIAAWPVTLTLIGLSAGVAFYMRRRGLGVVLVVLFMLVAIAAWQFERYM